MVISQHVNQTRIRAAIRAAEADTTARIHVTLARDFKGSTLEHAQQLFRRFRLDRTKHRNGVLFFVVPSRREFAVIGDAGIHDKAGQEFWERIVGAMSDRIRGGDLTDGLVHGIQEAGRELRAHFPRERPPDR